MTGFSVRTNNVHHVDADDVNEAYCLQLTNQSGASRSAGDVVVLDTANAESFTTTTSASDGQAVGVVAETIASEAVGLVQNHNHCNTVKVIGTVAVGDYLVTSTTEAYAASNSTTWGEGVFGVALTAQASGTGTIEAWLFPRVGAVSASAVDHGGLAGLSDDDHTQYVLATGARAITGQQAFSYASGAPFTVADNTVVTNLNADLLDGEEATAFADATHASTHQSGGADSIKLDDLAAPDDNTDLDATTSAHGLCPKGDNNTSNFLRGDLTWAAAGGGGSPGGSTTQVQFNDGGSFGGAAGFTYQSGASPNVTIQAQNAAYVPLLVKGAASQSVNYFAMQTSAGGELLCLNSSGVLSVGGGTPSVQTKRFYVEYSAASVSDIAMRFYIKNVSVNGTVYGMDSLAQARTTSTLLGQAVVGLRCIATSIANGDIGGCIGGQFLATVGNARTNNISWLYAGQLFVDAEDCACAFAAAAQINMPDVDAGSITDSYGIQIPAATIGAGSITNQYGIYMENISGATTLNYAIYTNAGDIVLNAGNGQCDFILKGANYNLVETDSSDDEIWIGNNAAAKVSFFAATPVVQQAHIIDADGTLADITTKYNTLLSYLEAYGLLAAA